MELVIVMPAFNEAACIEKTVLEWSSVLKPGGRLIVINDGSSDNTGLILDRLAALSPRILVMHQPNEGHGPTLLRGYRKALELGARFIFQTDSDNEVSLEDFRRLWEHREQTPLVLADRGSRRESPSRLWISRAHVLLNFLVFGVRLKDSNIPFRLIRNDFLREFLSVVPVSVFAPNLIMSAIAAKAGYPLFDVPVRSLERTTGAPSMASWRLLRSCLRCTRELIAFRFSLKADKLRDFRATLDHA